MQRIEEKNRFNKFQKEDAYIRAQKRIKELKGFYAHAFWYVVVNVFIFVIIGVNSSWNVWHFGSFATPLFWGIGLGFHALGVFGKNIFFSKSWEARQIKKFMDEEDKQMR
jgi:hypothetical protein